MTRSTAPIVGFVAACLLAAAPAHLFAQMGSLADAAKKAQERHEATTDTSKTYTDADLKAPRPIADCDPAAAPAAPATPPARKIMSSREEVVRAVAPVVVTIETAAGSGTGFFVGPDLVLTNHHVIESAGSSVNVKSLSGWNASGYVIGSSSEVDLALVRVSGAPATQQVAALGALSAVQVGEDVLAIGSPLGVFQSTVTRGIVSGIRIIDGVSYLQTDAAINPGNSGGPLVNMKGEVVGIVTMKITAAESIGFAIAVDHARAMLAPQSSAWTSAGCAAPAADSAAVLQSTMISSKASDTEVMRARGAAQFEATVQAIMPVANQAIGYAGAQQRFNRAEQSQCECGHNKVLCRGPTEFRPLKMRQS